MGTQAELLDTARESCSLASDNALSKKLGRTRSLVSMWRSDAANMSDEDIATLCAMAKTDGPAWLARIHADRAVSSTERAMWRQALDRLSAAAAAVALFVGSMGSGLYIM